jgi:phosphoribosylformimino-5-aminoimidazole carboxamide ribotide isomerase
VPETESRPATLVIFPAIDLRRGQVVRLRQGDPAAQTRWSDDPAATAQRWAQQGAQWLHVVNLDGALEVGLEATPETLQAAGALLPKPVAEAGSFSGGRPAESPLTPAEWLAGLPLNLRRLAEIRAATALPIQFGGGMRSLDAVAQALVLGATRVVLGTVAVRKPEVVARAIARFGSERIVVGIDARDGQVATHGWREASDLDVLTMALRMRDLGITRIVYTDIQRDGTLVGVNVTGTAALARESGLRIIASGGVASLADIGALAACSADGIEGVIVGQGLYTGALKLADALALASAGPRPQGRGS